MRRSHLFLVLAVGGALLWGRSPVLGQDTGQPQRPDYAIVGAELGATGALAPLERYVENGAVLAPFGGYMFNKYIGLMGQLHVVAMPTKDVCQPVGDPDYNPNGCYKNKPLEAEATWALGATVGPRLALPLGGIEFWGTFQGGGFTGLTDDSPISKASWAFSTGGGVNVAMTERISVGGFGRYNYLYQKAHSRDNVRFAAGGISLTYKLPPPEVAPPAK